MKMYGKNPYTLYSIVTKKKKVKERGKTILNSVINYNSTNKMSILLS